MIKLSSISDDYIFRLRQNSYFNDALICRAFPRAVKPTLLSRLVIAVRLSDIQLDEASIGSDIAAGRVSLCAELYIPPSLKNQVSCDEIISQLCKSASDMRISCLSCESAFVDKYADCFVQRVFITFNDEVSFEEQE